MTEVEKDATKAQSTKPDQKKAPVQAAVVAEETGPFGKALTGLLPSNGDMFQPMRNFMDLWDATFTSWPYVFEPVTRSAFTGLIPFDTRADVAETEDRIEIALELPGLDLTDVDVSLRGNMLTVRGEKKVEQKSQEKEYRHIERRYGAFRRTFQIPETVNPEKVEATFDKGVLHLTLAKHSASVVPTRKIDVKNAA